MPPAATPSGATLCFISPAPDAGAQCVAVLYSAHPVCFSAIRNTPRCAVGRSYGERGNMRHKIPLPYILQSASYIYSMHTYCTQKQYMKGLPDQHSLIGGAFGPVHTRLNGNSMV